MKIKCPFHDDRTASLVAYEDGRFHCFGCLKGGDNTELDNLGIKYKIVPGLKYIEDLPTTINYVTNLPQKEIRGLTLPYDHEGYYIVWPDKSYYIKRLWDDGGQRYLSPSGVKKPLFPVTLISDPLVVVEGQLNALSLAQAYPDMSIVSPGGTGDFVKKEYERYKKIYFFFKKIIIMVDNDIPGATAAVGLATKLVQDNFPKDNIYFILMNEDANDILKTYGRQTLTEKTKASLAMQERLSIV